MGKKKRSDHLSKFKGKGFGWLIPDYSPRYGVLLAGLLPLKNSSSWVPTHIFSVQTLAGYQTKMVSWPWLASRQIKRSVECCSRSLSSSLETDTGKDPAILSFIFEETCWPFLEAQDAIICKHGVFKSKRNCSLSKPNKQGDFRSWRWFLYCRYKYQIDFQILMLAVFN